MKLKPILLIIFFVFFTAINSYSQNYSADWGTEGISKEGMPPLKIIGESNGDLYLLKGRYSVGGAKALIIIEKYSGESQELVYSKEIQMPANPNGKLTDFKNIFLIDGKLILYTTYWKDIKSFKPNFAYGQYLSIVDENGQTEKTTTTLYEIEAEDYLANAYNVIPSDDHTGILVFSKSIVDSKLNAWMFDSQLNKKNCDIVVNSKDYLSISAVAARRDHVFFIIEEPKGNEYTYKLIDQSATSGKQTVLDLKLTLKNMAKNMAISFSSNAMFVSAVEVNGQINNGYVVKIDQTSLTEKARIETRVPLSALSSKIGKTTEQNYLYDFFIKNIYEITSGGFIITREDKWGAKLLVEFISATGKQEAVSLIPVCIIRGENNESFTTLFKDNKLIAFANDSKKNIDIANSAMLKEDYCEKKNNIIVQISIDNKGNWKREAIFEDIPNQKNFYPNMSHVSKNKETIVFNQKGKKVQFVKFK